MTKNIIVANNIRSAYNIGSIFRICDAFGFDLIIQGISPRPTLPTDIGKNLIKNLENEKKIKKSGLDGFNNIAWKYFTTEEETISYIQKNNYTVISVENNIGMEINLSEYTFSSQNKYALILGSEVDGVSKTFINNSNSVLQIPMKGKGKSLNVSVTCGIISYVLSLN